MASATYCTTAQLSQFGIRAEALRGIQLSDLQAAITAASDVIDGYLRSRYKLPLLSWGSDISRLCAKIAVYDLMVTRGFNSGRSGDTQIQEQYDDAIRMLRDISANKASPNIVDSDSGGSPGTATTPGGAPSVSSYSSRGYFVPDGMTGGSFQGRRR